LTSAARTKSTQEFGQENNLLSKCSLSNRLLVYSCLNWLVAKRGGTNCRQAELHTHGKGKETHEFIFSWLSWLAVLLMLMHNGGSNHGVMQEGGHTAANRLTESCSLGL